MFDYSLFNKEIFDSIIISTATFIPPHKITNSRNKIQLSTLQHPALFSPNPSNRKVSPKRPKASFKIFPQKYIIRCYSRLYNYLLTEGGMQGKNDKTNYGYIVSAGNNPTVIENALKKRNIWQGLSGERELLSAHFLWRQLNYSPKVYDDFQEVLKSNPGRSVLLNHFEMNHVITTKSGLLKTLKYYYSHQPTTPETIRHLHDVVPTSFIIHAHRDDTEYKDFVERFHQLQRKQYQKEKVPEKHCEKNVWFVKPESDNQGKGIILSNSFKEIQAFLVSKPVNSGWIVQKAIEKPLLYHGRKFDIRVWVLVTPNLDVYYYNTPYIRTSSSIYTTDSLNSEIHLTNNCQQKHFSEYSKFEEGNTVPMRETLITYINSLNDGGGEEMVEGIVERMKEIIVDTMMSARKYFGKGKKKEFQLFGYDFLIDEDYYTWLLQVNNNPYLGVPNNFIKKLLPLMVDEMLELVIDPIFPPIGYTPVQEKRFQLIYKDSNFKLFPVRVSSNEKSLPTRSISKQKSGLQRVTKSEISKTISFREPKQKPSRIIYSTPAETIKYLLDSYLFNDLDPFFGPVALLLNSPSLSDPQFLEGNIKKLKLVSESRIARILLEPRIYDQVTCIISQEKYDQKVKIQIINGLINSCNTFKARIFLQKNILPLICQNLRIYKEQFDQEHQQAVIKLLIATGGMFDRSIFIPGQSRQNEFVRQLFIKSNSLKLLLYLNKKYPHYCTNEVNTFLSNLSEKDWELFYESSGNKSKRCYSPKVNTTPQHAEESIIINTSVINDQRPRLLTARQATEIRNFRSRRLSGMGSIKKQ